MLNKKLSACLLLLCILFLYGCKKEGVSCNDMLSEIEGCFDEGLPSSSFVYRNTASVYSKEYLSPRLASLLYYGEKRDELYEMELLCDYAVRLSDGQSGVEIHILKVRAYSDCDTVEKMVRRRLEYMQTREMYIYAGEDYWEYVSSAGVYRLENFILLLSTPDNSAAVEKARRLLN